MVRMTSKPSQGYRFAKKELAKRGNGIDEGVANFLGNGQRPNTIVLPANTAPKDGPRAWSLGSYCIEPLCEPQYFNTGHFLGAIQLEHQPKARFSLVKTI